VTAVHIFSGSHVTRDLASGDRVVTLNIRSSDLETLKVLIESVRSEWHANLSKGIIQDDLTGIATAEAVLRKLDPLAELIGMQ
jgi:hypothetical protein